MSIDDFGTGFMSRSRLRTLKVSEVKIARTCIAALPGDRATVRSLIDLGSQVKSASRTGPKSLLSRLPRAIDSLLAGRECHDP